MISLKGVLVVGILQCCLQLSSATVLASPLTMTVTCDNNLKVYVDGSLMATDSNWQSVSTVTLSTVPTLVAIHCEDLHVVAGILAHFSDGQGTDKSWKCSHVFEEDWNQPGFDDGDWSAATEIVQYPGGIWNTVSGMTGNPYWIWTPGWNGEHLDAYCRKVIDDCSAMKTGDCTKNCGVGTRTVTSVCGADTYYAEEYCCEEPCPPSGSPGSGPGSGMGPDPPITMTATCDNQLEVYVNGALEATNDNWKLATTVHLGVPPAVIAIHCVDKAGYAGILAHLSNGEGTDGTWKCSNTYEDKWNQISFDDSEWSNAYQIVQYPGGVWNTVSGMTGSPYWIWSNKYTGGKKDDNMYCRKTLKGNHGPLCKNYPPFKNI